MSAIFVIFFHDFLKELYTGLLALYPEDYDPSQILLEHSGKMMVLAALLDSLKTSGSKERIVVVSNYTQVSGERKNHYRKILGNSDHFLSTRVKLCS